ncbi:MAG: class I SAM-dependent methyltransferase [Bacteroidetes bacterium]|nr:class I SAM-dependent methyltransferase [Bacteroidota bacterium]
MGNNFEQLYIKLRKAEQRILSDEQVMKLPDIENQHPHYSEWLKRKDTLQRFDNYLANRSFKTALEIGCGNGWFSNWLAKRVSKVTGQDINQTEVEQARRVFTTENLQFSTEENVLELSHNLMPDLVVFNASLQYFNPEEKLIENLLELLSDSSEIHILDTPV